MGRVASRTEGLHPASRRSRDDMRGPGRPAAQHAQASSQKKECKPLTGNHLTSPVRKGAGGQAKSGLAHGLLGRSCRKTNGVRPTDATRRQ